MPRICLQQDMILHHFGNGPESYSAAVAALEKANAKIPEGTIVFFLVGSSDGWSLHARSKAFSDAFIKGPDAWIIEI